MSRVPLRSAPSPRMALRALAVACLVIGVATLAGPARADEGGDVLEPLFRLLKCTPDLPSLFMGWFCTWV